MTAPIIIYPKALIDAALKSGDFTVEDEGTEYGLEIKILRYKGLYYTRFVYEPKIESKPLKPKEEAK